MSDPLGNLNQESFFADYWQQKPLLLRGLVDTQLLDGIDRRWLFETADNTDLESRLVCGPDSAGHFRVEYGPDLSSRQPPSAQPWTLLVRDVDKVCTQADDLLDAFAMAGRWRMEDVMVSFATPGGSVGPHRDHYDVFLIQASGQRHWQIDSRHTADVTEMPDQELKLLSHFSPNEHWVLQPGDCLYLPPGVPHHGVATTGVEDCITWSIGMRTPAAAELWVGFAEYKMSQSDDNQRLRDPYRRPANKGRITNDDLSQVRTMLGGLNLVESSALANWFGCYLTQPGTLWEQDTADTSRVSGAAGWQRAPGALLAWYGDSQHCWLFANGQAYGTDEACAQALSSQRQFRVSQWSQLAASGQGTLLTSLINNGVFAACD